MAEKRESFRVFLASTFRDLAPARDLLQAKVDQKQDTDIVRLEGLEGGSVDEIEVRCRAKLRTCDFAILILGFRYGSSPEGTERSYTELEFEAMLEAKIPYVVLAIDPHHQDPLLPTLEAGTEMEEAQLAFRERAQRETIGGNYRRIQDRADLVAEALVAVQQARSELEARSLGALARSRNALIEQLTDGDQEFATKYVSQLYVQRSIRRSSRGGETLLRQFFWEQFVHADPRVEDDLSKNCFVIAGRTGAGKTSMVCSLADRALREKVVPIVVSGGRMGGRPGSLYEELLWAITPDTKPRTREGALEDLVRAFTFIRENMPDHRVVIFIDAINELPIGDTKHHFGTFNEDLAGLLHRLAGKPVGNGVLSHSVRFCLTCRQEYWKYFSDEARENVWTKYIFQASQGLPTVELGEFSDDELLRAIDIYFRYYQLEGVVVQEAAREILKEPVMLRYFCEAYGARDSSEKPTKASGQVIRSISRMQIFDKMVGKYRQLLLRDTGQEADASGDLAFALTTQFLVSLANHVFERGGPRSFTTEEAHEVAKAIAHPDAEMSSRDFATRADSMFNAMVGHRILIEKEKTRDLYWFVFDSYYEFCLGRYFSLIQWARLDDEGVVAALRRLIDPASASAARNELTGAVPYALLMVDTDSAFEGRRSLFFLLIETLLASNYLWAQQALSVLRDSSLSEEKSWLDREQERAGELKRFMQSLKSMVAGGGWDHVQMVDVSRTLSHIAAVHPRAKEVILSELRRWTRDSARARGEQTRVALQRVYAVSTLVGLQRHSPEGFSDLIEDMALNEHVAKDFWSVRTLVAAAGAGVDPSLGQDGLLAESRSRFAGILADIAKANADGVSAEEFTNAVAIRGECAAALITVAAGTPDLVRVLEDFLEGETHPWVWWRVLWAARKKEVPQDKELVKWLRTGSERIKSPHVQDARRRLIDEVVPLDGSTPWAVSRRWHDTPNPGKLVSGEPKDGVIVYHPVFLEPEYAKHPECRERLASVLFTLAEKATAAWGQPARGLDEKIIGAVHNGRTDKHRGGAAWPDYLASVQDMEELAIQGEVEGRLSGPMEMRPGVYRVAEYSAGATEAGVSYLLQHDEIPAAWAVNRPPGHLANNVICVLNNAAYGAAVFLDRAPRRRPGGRVVILDVDVHHGKHTQQVSLSSRDMVFVSLHAEGTYSDEAGTLKTTGEGKAAGLTFNLPYPTDCRDEAFAAAVEALVVPVLLGLAPELIVLSCGFDGLASDPLTPQGQLSVASFAVAGRMIRRTIDELAQRHPDRPRTKVLGTIEGGYALDEMGPAYWALIREFSAAAPPEEIVLEPQPEASAVDTVRQRAADRVAMGPTTDDLLAAIRAEAAGPGVANLRGSIRVGPKVD